MAETPKKPVRRGRAKAAADTAADSVASPATETPAIAAPAAAPAVPADVPAEMTAPVEAGTLEAGSAEAVPREPADDAPVAASPEPEADAAPAPRRGRRPATKTVAADPASSGEAVEPADPVATTTEEPASLDTAPAKPAPPKNARSRTAPAESRPAARKPAARRAAKAATTPVETVAAALATPAGTGEVRHTPGPAAEAKAASGAKGPELKPINLGLQGGGAHGAFTWGVLDRLLEDGRIAVEGISGTSAGAMNAAVLATGLARGGNQGGREALDRYWRAVSKDGRTSPLQRTLLDRLMGNWSLNGNPTYIAFDMMSRFLSPYDLNPLNINPLMELIEEHVDFKELQSCNHVHVFVSATNVHTGKARVFAKHELTAQAIMASACLPFMFQAVEIDGVPYWDGGYMGNPALYPFYNAVKTDDILLVQINPIIRRETPKTARDINNRMNEITFNASLLAQLRAAEFVTRLLDSGKLKKKGGGVDGYRDLRLHRIDGAEKLVNLDASTKMNAEWEFLVYLKAIGREAAEAFLEAHFDDIGVRSTLDVREELRRG
ncbi:patatin-like phospholipase family protein [Ancylobacter amanitiformis]|uniref:Acylesterase/phospholipase RssA n=1 Tax=Ancylobacter amanitiformis TaxID=217069 RepID=A0ABU0LP67_9HYPH|nr:patatin-like phospholipase family protein [Ancylobacter amanitiformis]MDQ0510435.1 putative acylesterase/phospholipase RssA [Ancylobacter amanitiformis]